MAITNLDGVDEEISLRTLSSRHGTHNPDHVVDINYMRWCIVPKICQEKDLNFCSTISIARATVLQYCTPSLIIYYLYLYIILYVHLHIYYIIFIVNIV